MTKQRILHTVSSVAAGLVIATGVGVAGASQFGGFGGYGHSNNKGTSIDNDNDVAVNNTTNQNATSGDAKVGEEKKGDHKRGGHWNNHSDNEGSGGTALSGEAKNENTTGVTVAITNDGLCGCLEGATDGESGSHRRSSLSIDNNNDVVVNNLTNQDARSGDATVSGGNGGSATSGNASNTNTTTIGVTIAN